MIPLLHQFLDVCMIFYDENVWNIIVSSWSFGYTNILLMLAVPKWLAVLFFLSSLGVVADSFDYSLLCFTYAIFLCRRPTALHDRTRDSDDEDLHDRDYDVAALANNLSQAFRPDIFGNEGSEEV